MTSDAIKLVSGLKANIESVNEVADFLGLKSREYSRLF